MRKKLSTVLSLSLILLPLGLSSNSACAEIAVIASKDLEHSLSANEVQELYTGIRKNNNYILFDLNSDNDTRREFLKKFLARNENQLMASWSALVFSGYRAPINKNADKDVIESIKNSKNSIGYVDSNSLSPSDNGIVIIARVN